MRPQPPPTSYDNQTTISPSRSSIYTALVVMNASVISKPIDYTNPTNHTHFANLGMVCSMCPKIFHDHHVWS